VAHSARPAAATAKTVSARFHGRALTAGGGDPFARASVAAGCTALAHWSWVMAIRRELTSGGDRPLQRAVGAHHPFRAKETRIAPGTLAITVNTTIRYAPPIFALVRGAPAL